MDKNGLSSFLLGLGVGVGIGMLFAPKSGSELRNQLSSQAGNIKNTASEQVRRASDAASDWADKGREVYDKDVVRLVVIAKVLLLRLGAMMDSGKRAVLERIAAGRTTNVAVKDAIHRRWPEFAAAKLLEKQNSTLFWFTQREWLGILDTELRSSLAAS